MIGYAAVIPERARAVVIGGGVIGCSVLYHLAKQGWTDSVLVEQFQLTHGSTWHSAGLVGQLRSSISLTRMMQYSVGLYAELKELTGNDPGWHQLGGLRLASSQPRLEEIRRQASWAKTFGLPMEIVSAEEAQALFPPMSTDGVLARGVHRRRRLPRPVQLTFSLADAARRLGAQIEMRDARHRDRDARRPRRRGRDRPGRIECEVVVDAAGMYAPQIARMVGVDLPIIPFGHQYLITEPFEPPLEPLPTLRDPDNLVYFRTEVGGLVMGGYERKPAAWALDGIPEGFEAKLLPEDWDRMQELFANAITRVPAMETAEVKMFFNGPEAFTPDADFLLGETDVPGFWIAAGGCAHGLAGAGGIGKMMGEWIVDGRPEWDVWPLDLRRFGRQYREPGVHARAHVRGAVAVLRHQVPGRGEAGGTAAARLARRTRATRRSAPRSARRAAGSASTGTSRTPPAATSRCGRAAGRARTGRRRSRSEARAAREACALFDQSSFSKLEVLGPGALAFLERLCANRIDRPVGTVVYTQLLNAPRRDRGGPLRDAARRRPLPARHRHGVRHARPRLARAERAARRLGLRQRRHVRVRVPLPLGAEARAMSSTLDFPYMHGARDLARQRAGASRRASRTSASSAGSCTARAEYGLALWDRALTSTASRRAATGRSTRCGSRRATARGRAT